MDTNFSLSEAEEALRFTNPPMLSMEDTASISNGIRIALSPVAITTVGEASTTSYGAQRRELRLSYERRTCVLTLWGDKAINFSLRNDVLYTIKCIVPTHEFNHQRCYNSTPDTTFEIIEEALEVQDFEGVVESVSFESNLIEVNGVLLTTTNEQLKYLFPKNCYESINVKGKRCMSEVSEIDFAKKSKKD